MLCMYELGPYTGRVQVLLAQIKSASQTGWAYANAKCVYSMYSTSHHEVPTSITPYLVASAQAELTTG